MGGFSKRDDLREIQRNFLIARVLAGVLVFSASLAYADRITPAKPTHADVVVHAADSSGHDEKLSGMVVNYDDTSVTIKTDKADRELKWADLTTTTAFVLRSRLTDKSKGAGWLDLGKFAYSIGATDQAKTSLANAVRLDPTLKSTADAINASATTQPADGELLHGKSAIPSTSPSFGSHAIVARPKDKSPAKPTLKYVPSTPEQDMAAIARARSDASEIAQQFNVNFVTIETNHFLLFTDWDIREHEFLKSSLEDAYTLVSNQFEISPKENVFVGKLPVYMFAKFKDFAKFTDTLGFLEGPTPKALQGYYAGDGKGGGSLVMYKPSGDDLDALEKRWAHTLVHEFTHAFVARYRSNAHIPRWLNEGVAEVIAAKNFPSSDTYPYARFMAVENHTAKDLFDDEKMPGGEWYPVMQTLVEFLVSRNRGAFLKMFDAIKAGTNGEDALKQFYGVNYEQFYAAWRDATMHNNVQQR